MGNCQHRKFEAKTKVMRLQDQGKFNIGGYSVDLIIKCAECNLPFEFMGLPLGLITGGAAMSVDGLEARLSIQPTTQSKEYLKALEEQPI